MARAAETAGAPGRLAVGAKANIVVWSGDPFEFSTLVHQIFIGGTRISPYNRQQALFERYRTLQRREAPAKYDEIDMDMPE